MILSLRPIPEKEDWPPNTTVLDVAGILLLTVPLVAIGIAISAVVAKDYLCDAARDTLAWFADDGPDYGERYGVREPPPNNPGLPSTCLYATNSPPC